MARPEKEAVVAELTAKLNESYAAIVTDYRGLPVREMGELRRQLRGAGGEYRVVKNTLMRRAVEAAGMGELSEALTGPTAILFTADEPMAAAKALLSFGRQHGLLEVRGIMMGGEMYPASAVKDLAALPGREGVLAILMIGLEAPVSSLLMTLQAPAAELLATLDAVVKHKESAAA